MRLKYYIMGGLVIIITVVMVWYVFFRDSGLSMKKFSAYNPKDVAVSGGTGEAGAPPPQITQFCPKAEDLVKTDTKWTTSDQKWEVYTPSSANKILNFVGAQWVGIKYGQIICLYQTDEAVSFPMALEQVKSQLIVEPRGAGWGPLTQGNRRFCQSASVADCPFAVEIPKDVSNVYEEIKYAPTKDKY